ncbi:MAG TPA: phosphoribosylanthranilate isomerase [Gemmatimonadales bacterium]|nr:phosphoribosylanthranilate isomerase [Gemmatimonadales bacterium]
MTINPSPRPALEPGLIQVAGIIDRAEAGLVAACGVRYLGFPLRLPVNREDLSEADAAAIIRGLAPPLRGVLITYLREAAAVARFAERLGVRMVQLHGDIAGDELRRLRALDPGLTVVKSLVVGLHPMPVLEELVRNASDWVDAFLTDTYASDTGAAGATGRAHDWTLSRRLVELSPRPVILAGGLTPTNVRQAIVAVRPFGVDVHTGVEGADGRKERERLTAFVTEARRGFEVIG